MKNKICAYFSIKRVLKLVCCLHELLLDKTFEFSYWDIFGNPKMEVGDNYIALTKGENTQGHLKQ